MFKTKIKIIGAISTEIKINNVISVFRDELHLKNPWKRLSL